MRMTMTTTTMRMVMMMIIIFSSLLVHPACSIESGLDQINVTVSKELYLEGETININCTIQSNRLVDNPRDLYLYHGSSNTTIMPWSTYNDRLQISYPDSRTAAFHLMNASSEDRGVYKCCTKDLSPSSCRILVEWINVALPLLKPTIDECYVTEWSNLTCTWRPPHKNQTMRAYNVQQILQASLTSEFNKYISSSPTSSSSSVISQTTIKNAMQDLHDNAKNLYDRWVCIRVLVEAPHARLSVLSDVRCYPLLQLVKPSQPIVVWDGMSLNWSLPLNNSKDNVSMLFQISYQHNRTNDRNVTLSAYGNGSVTLDWRPHTLYLIWIEASYRFHGNRHVTTTHASRYVSATAPCRNPDTVENSFFALHSTSEYCRKIRLYFKPLQEQDWCHPNSPKYRVVQDAPCPSAPFLPPFQEHPMAYLDTYVSMETVDVHVVAFNDLGVSEDRTRGHVRLYKSSSNIPIWVEGDKHEVMVSWRNDEDDDDEYDDNSDGDDDYGDEGGITYTIFYCYSPLHTATCIDNIEWIHANISDTGEVRITHLNHTFIKYLYGISTSTPNGGTGITWTDQYYSLHSPPDQPKVLNLVEVGNGRVRLLWEQLSGRSDWSRCLILGYQACRCTVHGGGGGDGDTCKGNITCFEVNNNSSSHEFLQSNDDDLTQLIFWVRSKCRSGYSSYSVQKLRSHSKYMIIIIIVIPILMTIVFIGIGAHFIKRVKKWHKKLLSGIDIRPPDTMVIAKRHPDQKWLSSSDDPPLYTYLGQTSELGNFTHRSTLDSYPSVYPSLGDHDNQVAPWRQHLEDTSVKICGSSVVFSPSVDSNGPGEYCIINWEDHGDEYNGDIRHGDDCDGEIRHGDEGMFHDGKQDKISDIVDDMIGGMIGDECNNDLMTNYCKIQSDLLHTDRIIGEDDDELIDSHDHHQQQLKEGIFKTSNSRIDESCIKDDNTNNDTNYENVNNDTNYNTIQQYDNTNDTNYDNSNDTNYDNSNDTNYVSSEALLDAAMNLYHQDKNNNCSESIDDEDIIADDMDDNNTNQTSNDIRTEDDDIDECNGDNQNDNNNGESINPMEYAIINAFDHPSFHQDHKVSLTFYDPLSMDEEEENTHCGKFEEVASFSSEMSNAPYCALGVLLNDETRCLLMPNGF